MTAVRVMVVDDDLDIRSALVEALDQEGFQVSEAAHGVEALEKLRQSAQQPDVILLDLMMPVMSGWELWEELKRDPALAKIPVVVLSAGHADDLGTVKPEHFLSKPVDLSVLVETVRSCC